MTLRKPLHKNIRLDLRITKNPPFFLSEAFIFFYCLLLSQFKNLGNISFQIFTTEPNATFTCAVCARQCLSRVGLCSHRKKTLHGRSYRPILKCSYRFNILDQLSGVVRDFGARGVWKGELYFFSHQS